MQNPAGPRHPRRLLARRPAGPGEGGLPAVFLDIPPPSRRLRPGRLLRLLRRCLLLLLWTLVAVPVQAVLIRLPGRAKVGFARAYWALCGRVLGFRVRMIGVPLYRGKRPVVFVANHSSWLDIVVLGGHLPGCFVSKASVARWPLVGAIARLGRTVFVSRSRQATGRERDEMRVRLAAGDNLILFPEGTSSDGARVLPFRSAFFSIAEGADPPVIQPVSVVYDRLAGLPVGHAARSVFSWYGGMALGPHFWRLGQMWGMRATILVHPPIDPARLPSRKELAGVCWRAVAEGASPFPPILGSSPVAAAPEALAPPAEHEALV